MNTGDVLFAGVVVLFVFAFYRVGAEAIKRKSKRKRRKVSGNTEWWHSHPPHERVEITDKDTGESLGTITNRDLKFLIDRFEEQGMDDNDFYFNEELLEMFFGLFDDRAEKPSAELKEFLRNVLKSRGEVELHWKE